MTFTQRVVSIDKNQLPGYVTSQINNIMPVPGSTGRRHKVIEAHLGEALARTQRCIDEVKMWKAGVFDVMHSTQYSIFLYFLSNSIWKNDQTRDVPTELFSLNKALNAIDLFYEIEMPEVFFIGHTAGIVLAKATYSNHLVLYQNSTVGKNHGDAPIFEDGVIMYPNTAVLGNSRLRKGTVISQGVSVINTTTEENMIAFDGPGNSLIYKAPKHCIQQDFFRNYSH